MRITLDKSDVDRAHQLAGATFDKWQSAPGHYNNTLKSHLKGKLGEIALAKWAESHLLTVDPAFADMDRDREADLVVNGTRIDAKTWTNKWWPDLGRCLAVRQMPSLWKKADIVVWCFLEEESSSSAVVVLAGWSTISDIEKAPVRHTGPVGRRQVENHQLDESDLRSIDTLVTEVADA